jgi:hypothetical protein
MRAENKTDWNQVLINASIEAMQGIQESGKIGFAADLVPETLAALSVKIGKAMVEELKKEICGKVESC